MATRKNSKKPANRGLGRGLSALMNDVSALEQAEPVNLDAATPEVEEVKTTAVKTKLETTKSPLNTAQEELGGTEGIKFVNIGLIDRNRDQPRKYFDKDKLEDLTQSIKDKGVLQPILVRPIGSKSKSSYQIVAGERRWQAALKAGLAQLPVLVRDLSDQEVLEIGVVENVQRANLNPIEEALAYQALKDQFSRTQEEIAKAIGKSRPYIANMLRLLTLPERAQNYLSEGKISAGHARAIISAPDPTELADMIAQKGFSVREAEDWVRRLKSPNKRSTQAGGAGYQDADTRKAQQDLMDALGMAVKLIHKGPSGELRIGYKNAAQLQDLIQRLGHKPKD